VVVAKKKRKGKMRGYSTYFVSRFSFLSSVFLIKVVSLLAKVSKVSSNPKP